MYEELDKVLRNAFPETYFLTEEHFKTKKSKREGDLYFIEEDPYYAVRECFVEKDVLRINLWWSFVKPEFRKKGWATVQTEQFINEMLNKYKFSEVVVSAKCRKENKASLAYLSKIGLKISDIFVNKDGEHRFVLSNVS